MDQETKQIEKQLLAEIKREQKGKFKIDTYFSLVQLTAEAKVKGCNDLAIALEIASKIAIRN